MGVPWESHRNPMEVPWKSFGKTLVAWKSLGENSSLIEVLKSSHGRPTRIPWKSHGNLMRIPWKSHGSYFGKTQVPLNSQRVPEEDPQESHMKCDEGPEKKKKIGRQSKTATPRTIRRLTPLLPRDGQPSITSVNEIRQVQPSRKIVKDVRLVQPSRGAIKELPTLK